MHGLRGIVAGLLVLIAGNLAGADERAARGFTVVFADPSLVLVTDLDDLAKLCRTTKSISGCTSFVGERLACDCEQNGAEWSVVASVTASPVMYLTDPAIRKHEELHLALVESSVRQYLRRLTSRRFRTANECYRAEGREIVDFGWRMNAIRMRSNFFLH